MDYSVYEIMSAFCLSRIKKIEKLKLLHISARYPDIAIPVIQMVASATSFSLF